MLKTKTTRCKFCRKLFDEPRYFPQWCSEDCGAELGMRKLAKIKKSQEAKQRKADSVKREAIKSRSDWLREAQTSFNAFIRARDADLPCISCGRHHTGQYHAGHYLSVGARPELRFVEANVHKQCSACNNYLSGNIVLYRIALIEKIGQEMVDYLEGPHAAKKYTIEQLKAIKMNYAAWTKELKANQ